MTSATPRTARRWRTLVVDDEEPARRLLAAHLAGVPDLYDEHALRAFRARTFDYVLKPVEAAQILTAAERAVRRLTADATVASTELIPLRDDLTDRLASLLADLDRERAGDVRVTVWDGDSAVLLRPSEIQRATVDGNHVRVARVVV